MASSTDATLWLYTSLSSGSSHIVTATSRLETILKANKIPFRATDVATDEKARKLWGRRAGKRKLPGLVRDSMVVADLEEVEEWNEYGEIQENLGPENPAVPAPATSAVPSSSAAPPAPPAPAAPASEDIADKEPPAGPAAATAPSPKSPSESGAKTATGSTATPLAAAMQQIGFEAAEKASKAKKSKLISTAPTSTTSTATNDKKETLPKEKEADLAKLDNAAPTGMPPPSGESTAAEAAAPDTSTAEVESKADAVPEAPEETSGPTEAADAKGPESPLPAPVSTSGVAPEAAPPTTVSKNNEADTTSAPSEQAEAVPSETVSTPDTGEVRKNRGSGLTAASEEDIKKVEQPTKIEEEPEKEKSEEAAANSVDPVKEEAPGADATTPAPETGTEEKPIVHSEPGEPPSAGVGEADTGKTDEKLGKPANVKSQTEQHVKFAGETPGQEMDRVKAALGGKSSSDGTDEKAKPSQEEPTPITATEDDQLPTTRTQEQEAANPTKVGETVAD